MSAAIQLRCALTAVALCLLLIATPAVALTSLPDFTVVVENSSAAVVNVSVVQKAVPDTREEPLVVPPLENSDPGQLDEFLRRFLEQNPGGVPEYPHDGGSPFDESASGSGFVVSSDGYVITNHHVVEGAGEIIVRMSDRRELLATLVGSDERSDIALLKVEATDLPVLKLGSSEKLKVGEWVLAIGSPFNFDHSVTAGIVSAKGRNLPSDQYVPFLQTDVAINPGNSGGPLFNLAGEVVGINSQIYSRTGGFMGLSFAIPIEVAMEVVEQLKATGSVSRGWLGVYIQEITRELAESFSLPVPRGALVAQVIAQSPAEKAGVLVGDVLLKFNGKLLKHSADLPPLVGRVPVGTQAQLELLRDGKPLSLPVTIDMLPEDDQIAERKRSNGHFRQLRLGIVVSELDATAQEELNVTHGLRVEDVLEGPARVAGLRPNDVILSIDNNQVNDVTHFNELVADLPLNRSLPLLVQRDGGPVFLPLKLED